MSDSNQYSRRSLLAVLGLAATGGCLGDDPAPPGVARITLHNTIEREVVANVVVERDGEQVAEETLELDAYDDWENGGSPGEATLEGPWLGDRVHYEVAVEVPRVGTSTFTTDQFTTMYDDWDSFDIECLDVGFSIRPNSVSSAPGRMETCPE